MSERPSQPSPSSNRAAASLPFLTLAFALAAIALRFWSGAEAALAYDRTQVAAAQLWRLWTAHLVHFHWPDLLWNLVVFVPAGVWAERRWPDRFRALLLFGPVLIGAALHALDPSLMRYAGLSGVTAATLVYLALAQLRGGTPDRWFWRGVLLVVAAKIGLEFAMTQSAVPRFNAAGPRAVPLAHISGVLAAVLVFVGSRRRR